MRICWNCSEEFRVRQDEVESATQFAIEGTMKVSMARQARAKAR